jgi:hypothetical protein
MRPSKDKKTGFDENYVISKAINELPAENAAPKIFRKLFCQL